MNSCTSFFSPIFNLTSKNQPHIHLYPSAFTVVKAMTPPNTFMQWKAKVKPQLSEQYITSSALASLLYCSLFTEEEAVPKAGTRYLYSSTTLT